MPEITKAQKLSNFFINESKIEENFSSRVSISDPSDTKQEDSKNIASMKMHLQEVLACSM